MRSRTRRAAAVLLAATLATGASVLGLPAQAADEPKGPGVGWSAYPKQTKNDKTLRTSFFFEAQAGATLRDAVIISNLSDAALPLQVYPSDGYNASGGGAFGVQPASAKSADVGGWVDLAANKVTVPKGKAATVPFTLKIPRSARPGDHIGGIVTLDTAAAPSSAASGAQVKIQKAIAVKMYVRVGGDLAPAVEVSEVKVDATPSQFPFIGNQGKAAVTFTYTNVGNLTLRMSAQVTLEGLFGRQLKQTAYEPVPEVFPGGSVTLTRQFTGLPPAGPIQATVDMRTTEPPIGNPEGITASGDANTWVLSLWFVGVLILLIVAVVLWLRRRRRRAPGQSGDAAGSAVPVGSSPGGGPA